MKKTIIICAIACVLQACTWVKLTPEGEKTRVLAVNEVSSCKKLGRTTSASKADIVGIGRSSKKVQSELETLARNSAADLGGDTIVPDGEAKEGRQVFTVYRCVNP